MFKNIFKRSDINGIILLSIIYLLFVVLWSSLALFRLYNQYTAVYDLGLFAERVWLPLHYNYTFLGLLYTIFYNSVIPFIFSPISLFKNVLSATLIVQTIFIWGSAFPIYFIARKYSLSSTVSLIISLVYFFYPFAAGLNWFDAHVQAFFPFFFLAAYALYIYGFYKTSFVFFAIAALTKYPYDIFVALFALIELALSYHIEPSANEKNRKRYFSLFLLIFSVVSLAAGYRLGLLTQGYSIASMLHATSATMPWYSTGLTVFLIFAPLLFFSTLSHRWSIFFLVYLALIFYAHNPIYLYPYILTDQYSAIFIAFVFLGAIDVLASIKKKYNEKFNVKVAFAILVITISTSVVLQPWSPVDINSKYYYNSNDPYFNYKTYTYLAKEGSMIPSSDPWVMVSNRIPEAFPRSMPPYPIGLLVIGFPAPVFQPINVTNAANDAFPYITGNGSVVNIPIDYAWAMIYDPASYAKSGTQNIIQMMDVMLESGKYGIYAEANGTILIKRNFNGTPAFYVPFTNHVMPDQGGSLVVHLFSGSSYIFNNIKAGGVMWYGGSNYYPGTYNNSLSFIVMPGFTGKILIQAVLNGSIIASKTIDINNNNFNYALNITFTQTISTITLNPGFYYFIIESEGFNGSVMFNGLYVREVSPPNGS
ncbi:MAG: DUF2079 domain-containing protein [Nitrososphaeria archaeon]